MWTFKNIFIKNLKDGVMVEGTIEEFLISSNREIEIDIHFNWNFFFANTTFFRSSVMLYRIQ